jgi:putative membrane protein insertion efficiency factor
VSCSSVSSDCATRPGLAARGLLLLVEAYRALLSPLVGGHCRFFPSCSVYAEEALRLHGAARGSWLALRRVLRCQPFCAGGVDLVPRPPAPSTSRLCSRS